MKLAIELLLVISIKVALEYSYISFVYPVFEYAGFAFEFVLSKYLFGWILYILGYWLVYYKRNLYIAEVYLMLFLLFITPNIIYFGLSDQDVLGVVTICAPFLVILALTNNWKGEVVSLANGKIVILGISFVAVVSVIVHFAISTGGEMVLNFTEEYAFRDKFDKASTQGVFGYLNNWVAYIFVVVIFSWSLDKRKLVLTLLSVSVIFLLFALSGHKGVLQSFFLIIFFYFVFKFKERRLLILTGFLSLVLVVIFLTNYFSSIFVGSLIIRRLLFVPAHLNFVYLEFFSHNEFVFWSNGIMGGIVDYPYKIRTVELIGQYLGHENLAANTGFIATGFMHAGYAGILIYTLMASFMFNIINALAKNINRYFVMSLVFIPLNILFRSSDLLTSILTHGIIISILALWLYSNKEYTLKYGKFSVYKI